VLEVVEKVELVELKVDEVLLKVDVVVDRVL
jgi:hypothetical protein